MMPIATSPGKEHKENKATKMLQAEIQRLPYHMFKLV